MVLYRYWGRQSGKSVTQIEMAKAQQAQGKRVLFATLNQQETANMLARHGALSEVIGEHYLAPRFRPTHKEPESDE